MSIDIEKIEEIINQLKAGGENLSEDEVAAVTLGLVAFAYGFQCGDEGKELQDSLSEFFEGLEELSEKIKSKLGND